MIFSPSVRSGSKSRSGMLRFSEAVDTFARERQGPSWSPPIIADGPFRLPPTKCYATYHQQYYASVLLKGKYPDLAISEVMDLDESVPSYARRHEIDLGIDVDMWKEARVLADDAYNDQQIAQSELLAVLKDFVDLICDGTVQCLARHVDTYEDAEIDVRFWAVPDAELLTRYWSDPTILWIEGVKAKCRILVDVDSLPTSQLAIIPDHAQREQEIREKLREAKAISDKITPHGTIGELRQVIARHLNCDLDRASEIINEETEKCWSRPGMKGSKQRSRVKQIEIVQKREA